MKTFLDEKCLRVLLVLLTLAMAGGCGASNPRRGPQGGGVGGGNGATCGRSMVGEWQMVTSEPAAPSRGPNGLEAFAHLWINPGSIAVDAGGGQPLPIDSFQTVSDGPAQATLMAQSNGQQLQVYCPDGAHLVVMNMPVQGRFTYQRVR